MAATENYVTAGQVTSTGYAMIALSSFAFLLRFGLRIWKKVGIQWEDFFVFFSWASFLAMSILYIIVTPPLFRISSVTSGESSPYPTIVQDTLFMIKVFFTNTLLLWVSLWSVKLSLLVLYRRILARLENEIRWWWVVLIFTILSFIGCVISNFTSCSSLKAWFSLEGCSSPRDARAQIASLYYSFAVDVLTDIMIMVLPMRLIWSLRLPMVQKLSVAGIFGFGIICILMAVVRVVQIGQKSNSNSTPSSSWLAFWGMIEAGIAVIIGCLPAFAIMYRKERNTRRPYPYTYGYTSMPPPSNSNQNSFPLSHTSVSGDNKHYSRQVLDAAPSPSIPRHKRISVTRDLQSDSYNW